MSSQNQFANNEGNRVAETWLCQEGTMPDHFSPSDY